MVGKRRSAARKVVSPKITGDSLVCIHCRDRVPFGGSLPAVNYEKHLRDKHNIQYEMESIIDRTLTLQRPNMMMERRIDAEVQVGPPSTEQSKEKLVSNKNITIRRISNEEAAKPEKKEEKPQEVELPGKLVQFSEKKRIPWFAGCEYQCRHEGCGEMFFYNQDLRSHIKKLHGDPDDYLDRFKVFETKEDTITCKECYLNIKRHFSSVFLHLRDKHDNMTLQEYARKHKMKDYDKSYKVTKRVKQEKVEEESKKRKAPDPPSSSSDVKIPLKKPKIEPVISQAAAAAPAIKKEQPENDKKPWYAGCEYACQICGAMFYALNQLLGHVRHTHDMTAKPYQRRYLKFETKKYFYNCKLCFTKVKHSQASIQSHLATNHQGMKLASYEEVFHPPNAETTANIPVKVRKEIPVVKANNDKFRNWAKGTCTFQCNVCKYITGGSVDFWKHVKVKHNLEIGVYKSLHGNPCLVMNKITCRACGSILRYDYGTLLGHASTRHKMNLVDFYTKYYKTIVEKDDSIIAEKEEDDDDVMDSNLVPSLTKNKNNTLKRRAHMWGWKCRYKCAVCNRQFSTRTGAQKHINIAHGLSIDDYKAQYGPTLTKKVLYNCLICQMCILHDPSVIAMHVRTKHKITFEQYYTQYVLKQPPTVVAKKEKPKKVRPVLNVKPILHAPSRMYTKSGGEHYKWANNAGVYKCQGCPKYETKVKNTFLVHIKNTHGLTMEAYKVNYGSPLGGVERRHRCKICGYSVIWHAPNIKQHVTSVHGLTLKDYYEGHILESKAAELPPSSRAMSSSQKGKMTLSELLASDPTHWMNRCIFECKVCKLRLHSRSNFKEHLKNLHTLSMEQYSANFDDPMIVSNWHCCLMCQETILCDADDISEHLQSAHALSLEDYHDRFIANDRTVATVKKPGLLCRDWDHPGMHHSCLICSEQVPFSKNDVEVHLKRHGLDLRAYERKFKHDLDAVFDAFNVIEIENGEEDDDEDDFGSVFEDEEEEDEVNGLEMDPLQHDNNVAVDTNFIQTADDIDDIDIEENVDYITDAL